MPQPGGSPKALDWTVPQASTQELGDESMKLPLQNSSQQAPRATAAGRDTQKDTRAAYDRAPDSMEPQEPWPPSFMPDTQRNRATTNEQGSRAHHRSGMQPNAASPASPGSRGVVNSLEKALRDLEQPSQKQPLAVSRGTPSATTEVSSFAASMDSLAALEAEIAVQHERLVAAGMRPRPMTGGRYSPMTASTISVSDIAADAAPATGPRSPAALRSPHAHHAGPCRTAYSGGTRCQGPAQDKFVDSSFSYPPSALISGQRSPPGTDHPGSSAALPPLVPSGCHEDSTELAIQDRLQRLNLSVRSLPCCAGNAMLQSFHGRWNGSE